VSGCFNYRRRARRRGIDIDEAEKSPMSRFLVTLLLAVITSGAAHTQNGCSEQLQEVQQPELAAAGLEGPAYPLRNVSALVVKATEPSDRKQNDDRRS
jgi:hypothetical protein